MPRAAFALAFIFILALGAHAVPVERPGQDPMALTIGELTKLGDATVVTACAGVIYMGTIWYESLSANERATDTGSWLRELLDQGGDALAIFVAVRARTMPNEPFVRAIASFGARRTL